MMWMQYADRLHNLVEDFHPVTALERDKYATLLMDRQALRLLAWPPSPPPAARRT